jgi:hypothetical protein
MANEVTTSPFGGPIALVNAQAMADAVTASAAQGQIGGAPDGSVYLNFTGKRGVYEFGKDKEDIDASELWLVNIASFEDGYVCWKGGKTIATRMANIYSGQRIPQPASDEQGPFNTTQGEGWFAAKSMVVKSLEADDRQGYWKINSKSGVAVFADLLQQVGERLRAGRPGRCGGADQVGHARPVWGGGDRDLGGLDLLELRVVRRDQQGGAVAGLAFAGHGGGLEEVGECQAHVLEEDAADGLGLCHE